MSKSYAIKGIQAGLGPGGKVPVRREIDEWWSSWDKNDLNQQALFIWAMEKLAAQDPDDKDSDLSFFRIAEQRLHEIMRALIPEVFAQQDHEELFHAADTWRLPYWDWAAAKPDWTGKSKRLGPSVPYLLTQASVQVRGKTGTVTKPNPWYCFPLARPWKKKTFGEYDITDQDGDRPFSISKATTKQPLVWKKNSPRFQELWVDGKEQNWAGVIPELRGEVGNNNTLPERVYRLYNPGKGFDINYTTFSTDAYDPKQAPQNWSSLEDIHNSIHVLTGGHGHMSRVPSAAFDPIFWLHHNNVERLFSIWQELNPTKTVEPWTNGEVTVDKDTPLIPFSKDENRQPYTSDSCWAFKKLGYSFPELQDWDPKFNPGGHFDRTRYEQSIRQTIELLYSTTGKTVLQLPENAKLATVHLSQLNAQNLTVEQFPPALAEKAEQVMSPLGRAAVVQNRPLVVNHSSDSWESNDYIVNVLYDRFALDGKPYMVRVFLGDVPPGPPWYFSENPNEVGLVYTFSSPRETIGGEGHQCANCERQRQSHTLNTGQIILTDPLVHRIVNHVRQRGQLLQSLEREEVVPYLQTNLHWRVSDINDEPVDKSQLPDLKVSVAVGKATHYRDAARHSVYEDYEVLYEVTENRVAGANPGDLAA
ncbi:MAG: hypothetical protein Q9162_006765 [Coniocarpon cinnabarinum]